jgi:hypothetical protein
MLEGEEMKKRKVMEKEVVLDDEEGKEIDV